MEHKLVINARIYAKLFRYANAVNSEISGWGKVESFGGIHRITKIILLNQVCNTASTTLDSEKLTQMYVDMANRGEDPASYNLWWHSHYDFGVFWSATDEYAIQSLATSNNLFSICINKNGEMIGRIDKLGIKPNIPLIIIRPSNDKQMDEAIKRSVKNKVTRNYMRLVNNIFIEGEVNEKVKQKDMLFEADRFLGY